MPRFRSSWVAPILLCACGPKADAPEPIAAEDPMGVDGVALAAEGAEGPASAPRFELQTEVPPACVREESLATVRLTPEQPWHVNLGFPTALALEESPELELVGASQGRADARRLDADMVEFSVLITPLVAGEHVIEGELSFALCGEAECAPSREPVSLTVRAAPPAAC